MKQAIVERLRDRNGGPLSLLVFEGGASEVETGALVEADGYWYPIQRGVPSFLRDGLRPDTSDFAARHGLTAIGGEMEVAGTGQELTNVTFSDKWTRFKNYGLDPEHRQFLRQWYCKKLGLADEAALERFYADKHLILECGPGSGFNARFMAEHCAGEVFALDISDAAYTVQENVRDLGNCHAVQGDLNEAPFDDGTFDFVIADGVLHHTPDTRAGVRALFRKLKPGGQFFFYVYKQMGPVRRFSDEYVRERFSRMDTDSCYRACEGFTELGKALADLGATVTLEKGIPVLGIPAGTHDVQRLFYYSVMKCFWNDAFDFETNNMVNFDWYHPHHAWQHTREEVESWLVELGVSDYSFNDANPNGLSVLLTKPLA